KSLNDNKDLDSLSLAVIYENLSDEYKSLLLSPYVSIDKNEAHFSVRTIDSDPRLRRNEFLQNLRKNLDELLKDDNAKAQVSGIMVLYNTMLQSLISSQISTLAIVLSALFVTFIFVFKSTKFAILALIANIIPLVGVFGIMGFCGINLDIMSITVAAISLGIGVDNIIHYIHRYKIERRTKSIKAAITASHTSVGYAMYYTSFSIFLGFSVMTTSNFWPTIYFGLLTDLVMALMLLSALLLLPAMIILLGKFDFKRNLAKF
nr:MMPL family transporter [Campylobacter sp.]